MTSFVEALVWLCFICIIDTQEGNYVIKEKSKLLYLHDDVVKKLLTDSNEGRELTLNFDAGLRYDAQKLKEYSLIEEGERNNKMETVKKMLAEKCNISFISRITGLSKDEINEIKNNS